MLAMKLILIEGLPGSGKSTFALQLAWQLQQQRVGVRWFAEREDPHPTNIWEMSDIESFITQTIEKWHAFAQQAQASKIIAILEASLFQSFLRILFHSNVEPTRILDYGYQLEAIIGPLNPILIYFHHTDIVKTLRTMCDRRGQQWEAELALTLATKPYAKQRGLVGLEGVVQYWQAYQDLTDQLFAGYHITKLGIDDPVGRWSECVRQIYDFLSVTTLPEPVIPAHDLERLVGVYRNQETHQEVTLRVEAGELFIDNFIWPTTRLLPRSFNTFAVEGWCFELMFEADESGMVQRAIIGGRNVKYYVLVGHVLDKQQ